MNAINNIQTIPLFISKLRILVDDANMADYIAWDASGKSFHIYDGNRLAKEVLPLHFKHNNIASFIRQLNMYGFRKINRSDVGGVLRMDTDEMEFSHPYFLRNREELLQMIQRKPKPTVGSHYNFGSNNTAADRDYQLSSLESHFYREKSGNVTRGEFGQLLDIVKQVKVRQDSSDELVHLLKLENEQLYREMAELRTKYDNQTQVIQTLFNFLTSYASDNHSYLPTKRKLALPLCEMSAALTDKPSIGNGSNSNRSVIVSVNGSSPSVTCKQGRLMVQTSSTPRKVARLTMADSPNKTQSKQVFQVRSLPTNDASSIVRVDSPGSACSTASSSSVPMATNEGYDGGGGGGGGGEGTDCIRSATENVICNSGLENLLQNFSGASTSDELPPSYEDSSNDPTISLENSTNTEVRKLPYTAPAASTSNGGVEGQLRPTSLIKTFRLPGHYDETPRCVTLHRNLDRGLTTKVNRLVKQGERKRSVVHSTSVKDAIDVSKQVTVKKDAITNAANDTFDIVLSDDQMQQLSSLTVGEPLNDGSTRRLVFDDMLFGNRNQEHWGNLILRSSSQNVITGQEIIPVSFANRSELSSPFPLCRSTDPSPTPSALPSPPIIPISTAPKSPYDNNPFLSPLAASQSSSPVAGPCVEPSPSAGPSLHPLKEEMVIVDNDDEDFINSLLSRSDSYDKLSSFSRAESPLELPKPIFRRTSDGDISPVIRTI